MSVGIKLGSWSSVFAVPSCVVDKHLKIAGPNQLRILLFLLRNSDKSYTYKEIGDTFNIHEDDVKDYIQFWIDRDVLCEREGELVPSEKALEVVEAEKPVSVHQEKKTVVTRPVKSDMKTVSRLINEDDNLKALLLEVETSLSKPLSSGATSVIVMLYDTCGLPAEVIVMLVNYCVSIGKGNIRTIERYGVSWADEGIDSIEAADKKIADSKRSSENLSRVNYVFGINNSGSPTAKQLEFADRWINEWHFSDDMLRIAYEKNVDNTGKYSMPYINKILASWHNAGVSNPEDIDKLDKKETKAPERKSSYDLDELMKIK